MKSHRLRLLNFRSVVSMLILSAAAIVIASQFMLIRVHESSMNPTLFDGQWALVHRGQKRIHPGDIAVFTSPIGHNLVVKRYIFGSDSKPVIDHGWLVTPWGRWFLTGSQWERIDGENNLPGGLLFMVGDNQFQSLDSRNYGYIQPDSLVGRVLLWRKHG